MVGNQGQISNLAGTPSKGVEDGTDSIHTGVIKALQSFNKGDMCIGHAGFTITDGGTYTQYNLAQPIHFIANNKYTTHTVTLTEAYTSTVQHASHTRYDWVLLNPATPEIVIVQGTAATVPLVADITAGHIPIALVQITASGSSDDDKTDYSFQLFTLDKQDNSLSIGYDGGTYYVEGMSITTAAGDTTIENKVQDKDIIFKVNDGGASTEVMRIDGSDARVGIGGLDTTPDAMLHLKSSVTSQPEIRLENTTSDSQEACIRFTKKAGSGGSGAVADGDDLGLIRFEGDDDAGNNTLYSYISADVFDASNGDEAGRVNHYVMQNGSNSIYLQLSGNGGNNATGHVTVNPSGGDVDFIAESDNQTSMFKVDAGTDRVGILQGTPLSTLDINGSVSNKLVVSSATGGTPDLTLGEHNYVVFTQGGTAAVNMPAMVEGRIYHLSNYGAAPATLTRAGSDTFTTVGATPTTLDLNPNEWLTLIGSVTASTWYIVEKGALL